MRKKYLITSRKLKMEAFVGMMLSPVRKGGWSMKVHPDWKKRMVIIQVESGNSRHPILSIGLPIYKVQGTEAQVRMQLHKEIDSLFSTWVQVRTRL